MGKKDDLTGPFPCPARSGPARGWCTHYLFHRFNMPLFRFLLTPPLWILDIEVSRQERRGAFAYGARRLEAFCKPRSRDPVLRRRSSDALRLRHGEWAYHRSTGRKQAAMNSHVHVPSPDDKKQAGGDYQYLFPSTFALNLLQWVDPLALLPILTSPSFCSLSTQ